MIPGLCAHCGRLFEDKADGRVYRLTPLVVEQHAGFGNKVVKRWCSLECFVIDSEKEMGERKKVSPREG